MNRKKLLGGLMVLLLVCAAALNGCGTSPSSAGAGGAELSAADSTGTPAEVSSSVSDREAGDGKSLTVMIYLCGSDLESKAGAATNDLEEILASGVSTDDVNVAVMAGGTTQWRNGFSEEETAVYVLDSGGGPHWEKKQTFQSPEQAEAPADMGEAETLQAFLDYSYTAFPAQEYALIMWDHGGGPMRGLCWDTAWAKDNLTMEEFTGALAASPFAAEKLSWIGFDACLMSSVETAHLAAPYAAYMIASEETEPSLGWSYDFLRGIEQDQGGAETGTRIVDSFFEAAEAAGVDSALTLACADLSKIQAVEDNLDRFFGVIGDSLDAETFSDLSNLRQDTREFGKAMSDSQRMDLVDLGDLTAHYAPQAPEEAAGLEKALEDMVVYARSSLDNCSGLSAYHPYYNKTYFEKVWQKEYETFGFAPVYTEYMNRFAQIWMGDVMGDWTQMSRVQAAGTVQDIQYFSVQLTPEQREYYASAQLLVLSAVGNEDSGTAYSQVYLTDDVTVDENGTLTAGYSGRTLYALDDSGEVIAGPLSYEISDDGNIQISGNYINDEGGDSQRIAYSMFEFADAAAGTDLALLDQYFYDEDQEMWSNRLQISQEDYQQLLLLHDYRAVTRDGDRILPFSQWEDGGWLGGYRVYLPESIHFQFFDRNLEGAQLYACFQISDTQANQYGTELMPVENENVTQILFEEGISEDGTGDPGTEQSASGGPVYTMENELLRMTVRGQINDSENAKSMDLRIRVENLSGKTLTVSAPDGIILSDDVRSCSCFPSYETGIYFYELEPGESATCTPTYADSSLGFLGNIRQIRIPLLCRTESPEDENEEAESAETAGAGTETEEESGQEKRIAVELHPLNMDLAEISVFGGKKEEEAILAEAVHGNLRWELLGIDQMRNGDLMPVFLFRNEGEEQETVILPDKLAFNGVVLHSYDSVFDESVTLEPGTECCLRIRAVNRQYQSGSFEHVTGTQHLVVSDLLRSEGVDSIRTVSLLPEDRIFGLEDSADNEQRTALDLSLRQPVAVRHRGTGNGTSGEDDDAEEGASEETADTEEGVRQPAEESDRGSGQVEGTGETADLTDEALARALDLGGAAPVRTKLFSQDGVTVYGEHLLIADRTILCSMVIDNESDADAVVTFYNWRVNGGDASLFDTKYRSFAGTRNRITMDETFYATEETEDDGAESEGGGSDLQNEADLLTETSLCIRVSGRNGETELPAVYMASMVFDEGTAFNVDGGISLSFQDGRISVDCITETLSTRLDSIFDPVVACPEDPAQYRRTISFAIPDTLTEEERTSLMGVSLGVMRDCSDGLDAEAREKADLCLQSLAWIPMKRSEEDPDFCTCSYAGLVCVLRDNHAFSLGTTEDSSDGEMTRYKALGNGDQSSFYVVPDRNLYDTLFGLPFDFRISLENGKAEARLTEFTIDDSNASVKAADWPAGWFESVTGSLGAPAYIRNEDGTLEQETYGLGEGEISIPLEDGPVGLDLIPVTEFSDDIVLLYYLWFEDGHGFYLEGGAY